MPTPKSGESKQDYMSRCMAYPDMQDLPQDARFAKCNGMWEQAQKNMSAEFVENNTFDVKDVEIFSVGKWNGDEYTEEDLDAMVTAFNELKHELKPYLKLGHDNKQTLLQKDGLPSAGWIVDLKRMGKKLLADFSSVPRKIKELIEKKAYGRFSSEIYWNLKQGERNFKRVLKAVALLGADTPAVSNLNDFIELYTEDKNFEIIKNYHILEDNTMEVKELELQLKQYEADIKSKDGEIVQFKQSIVDLEGQVKELTSQIEAKDKEKLEVEVKSYIDSKIKEGKILPAQKEKYISLAMKNFDEIKAIVDDMPKLVEFKEESEYQKKPSKEKSYSEMTEDEKDDHKDTEAKKYMEEKKVTYKEALREITRKYEE